jgi:molybdopterin molybdotransferase
MLTFLEARSTILASISPLGTERVSLLAALNRVASADLLAPADLPSMDNSAMDGFAVRTADCKVGGALTIAGFLPAGGDLGITVTPGSTVRIMTGAPIPPGADAVIPWEECSESNGTITVQREVKSGQHIRWHGEDVRAGSTVVAAGTVIRPSQISMLASCGQVMIPVYRIPRVAILSTGDELVDLGQPAGAGKIINSNSLALAAAVAACGAEPVLLGIARDTREDHRAKLAEGLACDALITSAGVSAGDRDLVREVLAELGVEQQFWKILIKPGHPTAFSLDGKKPVFSLPGNPVSSLVTFEMFAKPALLRLMGHPRPVSPTISAVLRDDVQKKPGRVHFLRVRLMAAPDGTIFASTAGDQNTGILTTLLHADGLGILPADETKFAAGSSIDVHVINPDFAMSAT